jgi:putative ABC transport system ATP-binding protein
VQSGSIRLLGEELGGLDLHQQESVRRRIGFIFQAHNLFESLTARQNVDMAMELLDLPAGEKRARAAGALAELGLAERMDYKPRNLSGGQRQRVAIARALVNRPPLVLADEPTAALDKDTGRDVISLLQRLAAEAGTTVIIVTHDNRILDAADRIIHLTDGSVVSDVDVRRTFYICQFIRECSVFKGMTPSDLTDVAQFMELERFVPGDVIIRQGDVGDRFYLLRSGAVDVHVARDGASSVVASLGKGDFFGEKALLSGEPRNATVIATADVETFTLSKDRFLAAMRAHKSFEEQMAGTLFAR